MSRSVCGRCLCLIDEHGCSCTENWRCPHGWLRGNQCEICNAPKPAQEDEEVCSHCGSYCHERDALDKAERETVRLQKLTAQPAQKPVAWMYQCTADNTGPVLLTEKQNWAESGTGLWIETPLYAL